MATETARKRLRFNDMGTVTTIYVGPEEEIFIIHSSFLTEASAFFKAAITGNFKEATANAIKLPEECVETFEHFVRWLYRGCRDELIPTNDLSICGARIKNIIDLYVFADKIGCQELKQVMVRELYLLVLKSGSLCYPLDSVGYLYSRPITAEPLREITVAFYVWYINIESFEANEDVGELLVKAPEFAKEVLIEMSRRYGKKKATNPLEKGVDHFLGKT
ncbi:hypothetical protein EPUS_05100 [Endocarpon pusillum Z07020]|uniref:BTB domain-containing protein n=1 Tax=Endocarpon pusillum (strain Z07020 / HMAS-L-300199) TaxID=1263415 RepID=U1GF81_ENDPU|nr:uncharacterized protein EPUS_05100 [Endocarpon pusillum Z07020]ERF70748.1 hypothetical protein EPUS_05100 [Endocarpon pusillum Z07020]